MEFNHKLQELRKQKGLTQEELAAFLYVSRTAISKWESGRGYPGIDSLKEISKFFSVTVDALLSSEEVLNIAEEHTKQKGMQLRDLTFGLLDVCAILFLFLPLFGQKAEGRIEAISLLGLTANAPYMRFGYFSMALGMFAFGLLTLSLQNYQGAFWRKYKKRISIALSILGTFLFIVSAQPYAATFLFTFLLIKIFIAMKKP